MTTYQKFRMILKEQIESDFGPQTLVSDLKLDEVDMIDLIIGIEEEFGISISDVQEEDFKKCQTVLDIVHLIDRLIG